MNTTDEELSSRTKTTIDVEKVLINKYPAFTKKPSVFKRTALYLLRRIVHEDEVNNFMEINGDASGFEFVDRVLEYFDFSYSISSRDRDNIPSTGRVVIIANHPLGALDGLALLKMIGEVRRDVQIVVNDVLMNLEPLQSLFLPVDNMGKGTRKKDIARITDALNQEQAIVVFPAGEVSRVGITGLRDDRWNSGFIRFARKANAPILPIFISGKNSFLFYAISYINKNVSALMLANEMFNKRSVTITMQIGGAIPFSQIDTLPLSTAEKTRLIKRHLYRIGRQKKPLFVTEQTIARPQDRQTLKQELRSAELLGKTSDGKKIYLFDFSSDSAVMQEVGRLREIAFRSVGEGTGSKKDLDEYDSYYRHLILWDEEDLEIAGAYRLAEVWKLTKNQPIYSKSLFNYSDKMHSYFSQGIELGRSFVQPKYWGRRSLDYLWYGIGAYLRANPKVRYLFGPVSLSNSYPKAAKNMLVWFYQHYFGDQEDLGKSFTPCILNKETQQNMQNIFLGDNYQEDFRTLREQLDFLGVKVPTLYKQYSELCEENGVRFLDFGVDADFNYCIDGLVLVDIEYIKDKKRQRYMSELN